MNQTEVFNAQWRQRFGHLEAKGWTFQTSFVGDEMCFKSPRMKQEGTFVAHEGITDEELTEIEIDFIIKEREAEARTLYKAAMACLERDTRRDLNRHGVISDVREGLRSCL